MTRLLAGLFLLAAAALGAPDPAGAQPPRPVRLVVFGDSLTAGFLIPSSTAFPAVLEAALRQRGLDVTVADAAVSGDTAAGGLSRIDRDVPDGTDGVILELGANDRLRHLDAGTTRAALEQIVARLRARGIPVLLAGIRFSEIEDPEVVRFNAIYPAIARRYGLAYYPDIYAGLAREPRFLIFDGKHPSPAGVRHMVASILPSVERFVARLGAGRRTR